MASILADQQSANLPKKSRKPLKARKNPENEDNIMVGNACEPSPVGLSSIPIADKENPKHGARKNKKNISESLAVELQKMQEKLESLSLEKQRAEELLKERDALLKQKEEELEIRGKDQERLQIEIKKLQKLKEFNPNVALPTSTSEDKQKDKKEKKAKKKKDKKPCSAYILWSKEQWNQVKSENPGAEFKEISNILGSKWKSLSVEEKKPYEDRCQADKQAYQQIVGKEKRENEAMKLLMEQQKQRIAMELLEQYLQFKQDGDKEAKKKGKEKDPLKPKKPLSSFFLYCNERRPSLVTQNNNVLEISKIVGEEWKNMTEEDRAPYEEAAKKEKEQYSREMELYKQKKAEEEENIRRQEEENTKVQKQEALQLLKKKEKTEKIIKKVKATHKKKKENRDTNKPKKPPTSFLLFSKEARKTLMEGNPGVSNSTLHALISVRWKELNEADKKIWNEKAAEEMEAYKKAMEEYNRSTEAEGNKSLPTDKVQSRKLNVFKEVH
ncbi:high mobility group B protein 6-like [Nymphaea colorata]|nr:high mobility group B protein 6-like [Nymphaea colorata]